MARSWEPTQTTSAAERTRTEAFIRDIRLESMMDRLPDNVFPIKIRVTLSRSQREDDIWNRIRQPRYPWKVQSPGEEPLVPNQTVYFDNPVEDSPGETGEWLFDEFLEKHNDALEKLRSEYPKTAKRLYVTDLVLAEIPEEYVEDRNGTPTADNDAMSKDEVEFTIGSFQTRATKVRDETIKERLSTSVAGNVSQPRVLSEVRQVTHKGYDDFRRDKRYSYYTEDEYGTVYQDYNLAPNINDFSEKPLGERSGRSGKDAVQHLFPKLEHAGFLKTVRFQGHLDTSQEFIETDMDVL